jgi:hypothetical protein
MADYIYNEAGEAQGFQLGYFLYQLDGTAVGRVSAERVYRFDGGYVGELFKNMVVEKPAGVRRKLPPIAPPAPADPLARPFARVRASYGYPDVFYRLLGEEEEAGVASQSDA